MTFLLLSILIFMIYPRKLLFEYMLVNCDTKFLGLDEV